MNKERIEILADIYDTNKIESERLWLADQIVEVAKNITNTVF